MHALPIFLPVPPALNEIKLLEYIQTETQSAARIERMDKQTVKIYNISLKHREQILQIARAFVAGFHVGYSA